MTDWPKKMMMRFTGGACFAKCEPLEGDVPVLVYPADQTSDESAVRAEEIDRLRAENATLRELVREMYDSDPADDWDERAEKALS